jgi:hypothetical protein
VHPLYYAMLAFKEAGRGKILPISVKSAANLTAHATLGADGKVRVLLTNKDLTQGVVAHLSTGRAKGSVVRLLAPAADAKTGITFAGSAAGTDGKWAAKASEPIGGSGTDVTIALPAGSAAVVTLD